MLDYDFKEIETRWRTAWDAAQLYATDLSRSAKKLYCLVMFSYPSAYRLHVGHWFNFGPTDTWARMKRMQGFNIFEPMGFDAFGLPAENYAIKTGIHPQDSTLTNIRYMEEQLKSLGTMYDWRYEVITCEPEYYKGSQWLFLQLYKNKLAYRAEAPVNWCPSCATVLANEQVVDGACERCHTQVTKKKLTQWFFKITDYAQRLLDRLEDLDWPEETKRKQQNWIGRSEGAEITFVIENPSMTFQVFTTRPDTLYGVTYVVFSPEHPLLAQITTPAQHQAVQQYQEQVLHLSEIERTATGRAKTGVFTGAYAVNPVNGERVPIWTSDYVLMGYGTGIVMAVPGHDERDFEFARAFSLPIRKVILEPGSNPASPLTVAYTAAGTMLNSGPYDGLDSLTGQQRLVADLAARGTGHPKIQFRLRDWLISRQRYWGTPIPIVHCAACGEVPVPEADLPVLLPYDVDFSPTGESPLARHEGFSNVPCPQCGQAARREADTMDTFVCSSWYFLRYPFTRSEGAIPFEQDVINRWGPVDKYVGGPEHACMHLLYARFVTQALHDMGYLDFDEPFTSLVHQGIILGPDGHRMSKSRGNVVNLESYLEDYGSDAFRCYLMFGFGYTDGGRWDDEGIRAIGRFFNRVWRLQEKLKPLLASTPGADGVGSAADKALLRVRHQAIQGVTQDTEKFQFNTPLARLMEFLNGFSGYLNDVPEDQYNRELLANTNRDFVRLLAPFAPHLGEEFWSWLGYQGSIFDAGWPELDPEALREDTLEIVVQVNGKVREKMTVPADMPQKELEEQALRCGRIPELLEGLTVRKVIAVPKKLVNIVAG